MSILDSNLIDLIAYNEDFEDNEDIEGAVEQLLADQEQAIFEENDLFTQNTGQIIETSKAALAPRTLKAYTSLVPILLLNNLLITSY